MAEGVAVLAIIWVAYMVWHVASQESRPPTQTRDNGNGIMVPVCRHCQTQLVGVSRKTDSAIATAIGFLAGMAGLVVFLFVHWIGGLVLLIVAVLIHLAGKGRRTVLTCPACGADEKAIS